MPSARDAILSLLFPSRCAGCSRAGTALCRPCADSLPHAAPASVFAAYDYGHPIVQKAVRELKYRRRSELAQALIGAALPRIRAYLASLPPPYVLVPVPQHKSRTRERGFNQSELIARHIDASRVSGVLRKTQQTPPQAALARGGRAHNLNGSMEAVSPLDPGSSYVIIDDVYTTGATVAEAKRALEAAGARRVYGIAVAHGYRRK